MMLSGQRILVIGTEPWYGPLLSKHHIVLELCRENQVLYLEPAYHVGNLLRGRLPRNRYGETYHDLHPASLRRIKPWRFPKSESLAVSRGLSQHMLKVQIAFRRFRPDVVLSFDPAYDFLVGYWRARFVFYAVDSQLNSRAEAEALARADLVVAATEVLYERYRGQTRRLEYLPHGVNPEMLDAHAQTCPHDMVALPHPLAGFVGAVNAHLDIDLLLHVAQARPQWSWVLIGPYATDAFGGGLGSEALARLRAQPNIHLLGPKPVTQLGAYINQFDVGLMPYDLHHPRVHFSYHKTLQYLALGKPVVTTCAANDETKPPQVWVGETAETFMTAIEQALLRQQTVGGEEGRAFARQHTWRKQIEQLAVWIEELQRLADFENSSTDCGSR